ncbi:MAG: hypothetical protein LBF69_00460 [Prevotellaceae bacterium]|jgi:hypothetical protein|nr:hypothetical protein [Prevotellaceae bacterium]
MTEKAKRLGRQPAQPTMNFNENMLASEQPPYDVTTSAGLTKREYFAGLAMQGWLTKYGTSSYNYPMAQECIKYADALLEELTTEIK